MAESFTRYAGIPMVYMSIDSTNNEEITINFRQQRLVKEGPGFYDTDNHDYGYSNFSRYFDDEELIQQFAEQRWWIPLKIETILDDETQINELMNEYEYLVTFDRVRDGNDEYYLLNSELKNYFRVNYDNELLNMIKRSWDSLSFWNQFNVIADRYELMTYSYASAVSYLELLDDTMGNNDDDTNDYLSYLVWNTIIDSLYTIDDRFCVSNSNKALRDFRRYAETLLKPLYRDLNGYEIDENDNANILNLRNSVIMALIRFEDNNVINDGVDILNDLDEIIVDEFGQIEGINGNILQAVITAGVASMDMELYDLFFELYPVSNGVQRSYIRFAFSTLYNDNDIVMETYEYILRGYKDVFQFSNSDKVNALNNLATCVGTGYVWDELTSENDNNDFNGTDWEMLFAQGYSINTLITMVNTFATRNRYDEVYKYYYGENGDLHRNENNERIINQTLENIAMNTMWLINNEEEMEKFLIEDDDDGLEGWAIALIVIGCIVFVIIVLVAFYCCRKRTGSGSRFKSYTQMTSDLGVTHGYGATGKNGN
eukprot:186196_1